VAESAKAFSMNLHQYWNERAASYEIHDVLGRNILKHYIENLSPQSLVDVGCGKGELFPLFNGVPRVVALDFSENMLQYARRRVERHALHIELKHLDITKSYLPEKFDVALTRTVLMHIHPDEIKAAAKNIGLMSDRLFLFEYWETNKRKLANHNWLHDYMELFTDLGYRLIDSYNRSDIPQVLFMFER
jgi:SAM-dependent methyltransferase